MNVEMLVYAFLVIFAVLSIVVLGRLALGNCLKWSKANRRANELLHSVLTSEQYLQLARNGYLDIPSPRDPGCIYRVPQAQSQSLRYLPLL
jgi:hypothetical protein